MIAGNCSAETVHEAPTNHARNGQFVKGNKAAKGNPHARQMAKLRTQLLGRITGEDLGEVLDAMVQKAKTGDVVAAKLVLDLAVGKSAPAPNPDRLDEDEANVRRDHYEAKKEMLGARQSLQDYREILRDDE